MFILIRRLRIGFDTFYDMKYTLIILLNGVCMITTRITIIVLFLISSFCFGDGLSPKPLSDVVTASDFIGEAKVLIFQGDTAFTLDEKKELKSQSSEYQVVGKIGWMYKGVKPAKHILFTHKSYMMKGFWLATEASGIESDLEVGKRYIFFWKDRGDGRFMLLRAEDISSRVAIVNQLSKASKGNKQGN